ncbi:hypothetical protein PQQ75_25430 [Paraburkholderia aspalathi]|uniref:hypothetical protein n=1 Tax=Paraburkholderia aspalathi TaxID=1324617 RepID=UPI0038B734DE
MRWSIGWMPFIKRWCGAYKAAGVQQGEAVEGHQAIVEAINDLKSDLDQRHDENVTRHAVTDKKVDEAIRRIDDLHKAFPGGDWEGHRRYHETIIAKNEARANFYGDLRSELAKKGVWAVIVVLALALWQFFKTKVTS